MNQICLIFGSKGWGNTDSDELLEFSLGYVAFKE